MVDISKGYTINLQRQISPRQYQSLVTQYKQQKSSLGLATTPVVTSSVPDYSEEQKALEEQKAKDIADIDRQIAEAVEKSKRPDLSSSAAKEYYNEAGRLRRARDFVLAGYSQATAKIQARAEASKYREQQEYGKMTEASLEIGGSKAKYTEKKGGKFIDITISQEGRVTPLKSSVKKSPIEVTTKRQADIYVDPSLFTTGVSQGKGMTSISPLPQMEQTAKAMQQSEYQMGFLQDIPSATGIGLYASGSLSGYSIDDLNRAFARNLEKASRVKGGTGNLIGNLLTISPSVFAVESFLTARKMRKSAEETIQKSELQQRGLALITPQLESQAVRTEALNIDVGQLNKDIEEFNLLYGGRELSPEEYTTATRRQEALSQRSSLLTTQAEEIGKVDILGKYGDFFKSYDISYTTDEGRISFTSPEMEKIRSGGLAPMFYKSILKGYETKGTAGAIGTASALALYKGGTAYLTFFGVGRIGTFAKASSFIPKGKAVNVIGAGALGTIGTFGVVSEYQTGEYYGKQLGLPKYIGGGAAALGFTAEFGGAIGGAYAGTKAYYKGIESKVYQGKYTYNVRDINKLPSEVREGVLYQKNLIETGKVTQAGKYVTRVKGTKLKYETNVRLEPSSFYEGKGQTYINIETKFGKEIIKSTGELVQVDNLGRGALYTKYGGKIFRSDFGFARDVQKVYSISYTDPTRAGYISEKGLSIRTSIFDLGTKPVKKIPYQAFSQDFYKNVFGEKGSQFILKGIDISSPSTASITKQSVRFYPKGKIPSFRSLGYSDTPTIAQRFTSTSDTFMVQTSVSDNVRDIAKNIAKEGLWPKSKIGSLYTLQSSGYSPQTTISQVKGVSASVQAVDVQPLVTKQLQASGVVSKGFSSLLTSQRTGIALSSQLQVRQSSKLLTAQTPVARSLSVSRVSQITSIKPAIAVTPIVSTTTATSTATIRQVATITEPVEIPISTTPTTPVTPIVPRPIVPVFPFDFPKGDLGGVSNIIRGGKRRTRYTPSITAIIFNIKGRYKPSYISKSGLDFRPIPLRSPVKRRKKRRRK